MNRTACLGTKFDAYSFISIIITLIQFEFSVELGDISCMHTRAIGFRLTIFSSNVYHSFKSLASNMLIRQNKRGPR